MSGNDPAAARAQLRPYYNPATFNVGYDAVFSPDAGVLDARGESIASRLGIAAQNRSRMGGRSVMAGAAGTATGLPSLSFGLGPTGLDLLGLSRASWQTLLCRAVLRPYLRNIVQQPFETCKVLMQTAEVSSTVSPAVSIPSSVPSPPAEIDFFPLQTQDTPEDTAAHWGEHQVQEENSDTSKLDIPRLTTWSVVRAMRGNANFGISALWRANNVSFIYSACRKGLAAASSALLTPLLRYVGLQGPAALALRVLAAFAADVLLLPLDLCKVKQIVSEESVPQEDATDSDCEDSDEDYTSWLPRFHNYWAYALDDRTLRLFGLLILRIACNRFFDNGLEYLVYHWLSAAPLHNKIHLLFLLRLATEVAQFFVKLPIETLLRRCQVDYLLKNTVPTHPRIQHDDLIITPVDVSTPQVWRGLWNGWRVALMSLVAGFGFRVMNNIDDDLEQERF